MNTDAPPITLEPFVTDECRCPACVPHPLQAITDAPPLVPALPATRTIIALTGLAGSGKSTVAAHLVKDHGYTRVRFAGPLKAMMAALGLTPEQIDGSEKEKPCDLLGGKTPRFAMQRLGTEFGRDIIDPDLWIRAWRAALPATGNVVVDDCRFPNEADAVRAAGGILLHVDRPGLSKGSHVSEGQDLGTIAGTIRNTASVGDLLARVDEWVRDLSWVMAARAS